LTKEQFDRQLHYSSTMALARAMRGNNIINEQDYHEIDKRFANKYPPLIRPQSVKYLTRRINNLDYDTPISE
jgi:hypothetical protein